MIVDSSAVVAVFFKEPGFEGLFGKLASAENIGMGAPTLAETGIVLGSRMNVDTRVILARFLQEFGIVVVPFGELHWREAVDAYGRFGRRRHPASLNFGDCMTYATAKLAAKPLLCVGDDFTKTDLEIA
jgi:ribonuclease VapC